MAFNDDGSRLATSSGDNTVNVWDTRTGLLVLTLRNRSGLVRSISFSRDGKHLASVDDDGWVRVYAMDINELLALARKRVTRPLTDEECKTYFPNQSCPKLP